MLNSIASLILLISLIILVYYFVSLAISFIVLFGSLIRVGRKMRVVSAQIDLLEEALEPVSILIPAHNEQLTIVETQFTLYCVRTIRNLKSSLLMTVHRMIQCPF